MKYLKTTLFFLVFALCKQLHAQLTTILTFSGTANGSWPNGSVISDGVYLYGMTANGGLNNLGIIFKVKFDGSGYVKLFDFNGSNGQTPNGSLISDGSFLYGMTTQGGIFGRGTIFKIKTDGTGYLKLFDFNSGSNGQYPFGSLIIDGSFLYGMAQLGGVNNLGTIFKIKNDGTGYVNLLDFSGASNGSKPIGSLISDGTYLYGMTQTGGSSDLGTTFKIKTDGTGYVKLLDFNGAINGQNPMGSLLSDGVFLYGMTKAGGASSYGTIFKIKSDGTGYLKILDFNGANGRGQFGSLIYDGIYLYGMTLQGGINSSYGNGFKIKTDGTNHENLFYFNNTNGVYPYGSLYLDKGYLYGMTSQGGASSLGVLFKYATPGAALNFDGVDDYVQNTSVPNMPTMTAFTIESWVNLNNTTNGKIFSSNEMEFSVTSGQLEFSSPTFNGSSTGSIASGIWQHVAATYNGSILSFYINGVLSGTSTATGNIAANTGFKIGKHVSANCCNINGSLDELKIWNRSLCQSEIQNNMNAEIQLPQTGLVSYYNFNQGDAAAANPTVTILNDISSNGNNGALSSFTLSGSTSNWVAPGCIINGSMATVFNSTVSASVATTSLNCFGTAMGSATITANGEAPYTYLWPTSISTTSIASSLSAGNYSVLVTNGCGSSTTVTLNITGPTALSASSIASSILCNGSISTVTVTANGGTSAYTGVGTFTALAGTKTYTVADANNCSTTTSVLITQPALITSAQSFTLCQGQSVVAGASTYSSSGTFTTPVTSLINGCDSIVTTNLIVNPLPIISATTNNTLLCSGETSTLTVAGNATTYTWSTAETTINILVSPTIQTTYTVDGKDINGCLNTTAITQSVSLCTGIAPLLNQSLIITIYPNPNNGEFIIKSDSDIILSLTNNLGQVIQTIKLDTYNNRTIIIENIASGIYFISGQNGNQSIKQKIVVKQ